LAGIIDGTYAGYGDEEFVARLAESGVQGVETDDWASPGAQTTPVFRKKTRQGDSGSDISFQSGKVNSTSLHGDTISSQPQIASFSGSYVDLEIDANSDGVYEFLRLDVGLTAVVSSLYNVTAWLADATGTEYLWASTSQQLAPGTHTVELLFDGTLISEMGIDGPYTISWIEMRAGPRGITVETVSNALVTGPYQYTQFALQPVQFTNTFSDTGIDIDGNGLYEKIQVTVGLNVQETGTYTITGELEGSTPISVADNTLALEPSVQNITLEFDTSIISQAHYDGPLYLKRLRIEDAAGNRLDFINDAYTLSNYTPESIEKSGVSIDIDNALEQGLDFDNDGDLDYLRVELPLNVNQSGIYILSADLEDSASEVIDSSNLSLNLTAGVPTSVTLDFSGTKISEHQANSPYTLVRVTILDENEELIDYYSRYITTGSYDYTQFNSALLTLTNVYQDFGEDTDNNGLYGNLVIEIGIIPASMGVITVNGRLVDSIGNEIDWTTNTMPVIAIGTEQKIKLAFDGNAIDQNGISGTFELRDLYAYNTADPDQGITVPLAHTTQPYDFTQFESEAVVIDQPPNVSDSNCNSSECNYSVMLGSNGFYVFVVTLPSTQRKGFWALGINSTEVFTYSGGFHGGASLNGDPGWIGFSLLQPEPLQITISDDSGQTSPFALQIEKVHADWSRQFIEDPIFMTPGETKTITSTSTQLPGFYVIELSNPTNSQKRRFGLSVNGKTLFGGVVGGWIDSSTSLTGQGYGAFNVPSPRQVDVKLYFGKSFDSFGSGQPQLEIHYLKPDNSLELYWIAPH
jgi:hypothetical protein